MTDPLVNDLRCRAGEALSCPEIGDKGPALASMEAALAAHPRSDRERLATVTAAAAVAGTDVDLVPVTAVGRPVGIELVAPRHLPRRTWGTDAGRFATLHALAHIEANAVNLALDAVHRFGGMPLEYYADWTHVAAEELRHFLALCERLRVYGGAYGDLACHDGLWDIAVRTAHDVGARMALVPLVFEARGLDVTPGLIERFERHGDPGSAELLGVVLADEIGHVEVGSRWFASVCADRGLDPTSEFERLVDDSSLLIVPPFNVAARVAAGFSRDDLARWEDAFTGSRGARS